MGAETALGGVKEAKKGGGLLGDSLSVSIAIGEGFRPQVESAEIARGNYGYSRLREQETPTAQSAERAHFGTHAHNRER
jgi:hypothetical protein